MEIIFVHLNSKIPLFVRNNLLRVKIIAGTKTVTLLSNVAQPQLPGVKFVLMAEPAESIELKSLLAHPKDFRENFWHSSIARFAYLSEYQSKIDKPIIHFESDVLVSHDFPFAEFTRVCRDSIAYPILSLRRGVGSVLYSPNPTIINEMVQQFIRTAKMDSNTTDMLALREFYNLYPEKVYILPAGPNSLNAYHPAVEEDIYPDIESGLNDFNGIFDGADLGLYFFGTNPNNARGVSYLRREVDQSYSNMSSWQIMYNKERDFIDLAYNGKCIPIYNLHLTSKRAKHFTSSQVERKFDRYIEGNRSRHFLFDVYLKMFLKKVMRLLRFN